MWHNTDEDKFLRKHYRLAKKSIEDANGIQATDEQVYDVLRLMKTIAKISVSHFLKEAEWNSKLKDHPKGYHFEPEGYSCRICGGAASGTYSWYDEFGLKCSLCQKAIDWCMIPAEVAQDKESYYCEHDLSYYFNVSGKPLKQWMKMGIIKRRTILNDKGGKHYLLFLMSENKDFLPPKEMLRIGGIETEEIDGKTWQVSHPWYHYVNPFEYLKDYRIMQYLQPKGKVSQDLTKEPVKKEPEPVLCQPCAYPRLISEKKQIVKRKAKRKKDKLN